VAGRDERRLGARIDVWMCDPGPSGIPIRYQMTKKRSQATVRMTMYGSIIATTVPMPASFLYRCVNTTISGK
jgi:hypothetical protein